ncbi:MAG TPA: hypothetical protein VFA08_05445 [Actinomycetota bacterium]|jgi:hypothetical protein|nr:hypothetical protein [Actinomycetota bacterium]
MTALRTFRSFVAIGMVVAFNLLMIALAAMAGGSIDASLLAVWIGGDFALSLLALGLTER